MCWNGEAALGGVGQGDVGREQRRARATTGQEPSAFSASARDEVGLNQGSALSEARLGQGSLVKLERGSLERGQPPARPTSNKVNLELGDMGCKIREPIAIGL